MLAEVEVPLGPSVAEVPISAEVEVPLGSGAAAVSMAAIAPDSFRFPDSFKFHASSLPCPAILHVLHTQMNNKPYKS
jgi:hypothetical protein